MKKIEVIMMLAMIGLAPMDSIAVAQNKAPAKKTEQQIRKQQWKKGNKYGRGAVVTNHRWHKLQAPPTGYHWVRDGNDFILVATATGVIANAEISDEPSS